MNAEDVPAEWVKAARDGFWRGRTNGEAFRLAIAAVAPLIAAQERERCAGVAEAAYPQPRAWAYAPDDELGWARGEAKHEAADDIAAAIRALD